MDNFGQYGQFRTTVYIFVKYGQFRTTWTPILTTLDNIDKIDEKSKKKVEFSYLIN